MFSVSDVISIFIDRISGEALAHLADDANSSVDVKIVISNEIVRATYNDINVTTNKSSQAPSAAIIIALSTLCVLVSMATAAILFAIIRKFRRRPMTYRQLVRDN